MSPKDSGVDVLTCPASDTACGDTCKMLTTDSDNCGSCGRACGEMSTCSGGLCTPVVVCADPSLTIEADANAGTVDAGTGIESIVLDDAITPNVYWVGSTGLVRCSSDPTVCQGSPTLIASLATPTVALAVDSTYVYYVNGNTLYRVAR